MFKIESIKKIIGRLIKIIFLYF